MLCGVRIELSPMGSVSRHRKFETAVVRVRIDAVCVARPGTVQVDTPGTAMFMC